MKFLDLKGGVQMPALGFGTWQLTGDNCVEAISHALAIGYRHIDTAQVYENEAEVGQAIADGGIAREELFVTTKVWTTNFKKADVVASTEASLDKLKMDYVDLLLLHWPNPQVDLGESLEGLQQLLAEKKTRAIGVSNFPVALMQEAIEKYHAPLACNQVEYHAMLSQKLVLDYAHAHEMIVTAYSPLGRGKLTKDPVLAEIGEKYGKTAGQVALRWLVQQESVAAIPKASSETNARANFEIFDFTLENDDLAKIALLGVNKRLVNPDFAPVWDAA